MHESIHTASEYIAYSMSYSNSWWNQIQIVRRVRPKQKGFEHKLLALCVTHLSRRRFLAILRAKRKSCVWLIGIIAVLSTYEWLKYPVLYRTNRSLESLGLESIVNGQYCNSAARKLHFSCWKQFLYRSFEMKATYKVFVQSKKFNTNTI